MVTRETTRHFPGHQKTTRANTSSRGNRKMLGEKPEPPISMNLLHTETVRANYVQVTNINNFKAGKIADYVAEWKQITSDQSILDLVTGYHMEFNDKPVQYALPRHIQMSDKESIAVMSEINKLLAKGVLVEAQHQEGEFLSTIFTRPKKDSSQTHFKSETT